MIKKEAYKHFFNEVLEVISNKEKANKRSIEKMAYNFGITDKNTVKEITENAIVTIARKIANQNKSVLERYNEIVSLYNSQVNLSHRTSQSMLLQQYSTPATIGFLMGIYCKVDKPGKFYEPSAGNGMLTIANSGKDFTVNEIDQVRYDNLQYQNVFKKITKQDSSTATYNAQYFDAILTNPPFASLKDSEDWLQLGDYTIKHLDHKMAILALNSLKDYGRAAIIVGGHTTWDAKGRITAGKNRIFLSYLYKNYFVDDIINVDGNALYSKMGTGFDTRIILIKGRKQTLEGFAPLKQNSNSETVTTHKELYNRIAHYFEDIQEMANFVTKNSLISEKQKKKMDLLKKIAQIKERQQAIIEAQGLGMPYIPAADGCFSLEVDTPDSMSFEIHAAIKKIKQAVGGSLNEYLVDKLKYPTDIALCKALAAEQIDGVATAVYNIEKKNQGIIIGDQTGIGKGRQAAAIIRYAKENGLLPIFISEKTNLFTDMYRDLSDINTEHYRAFILNEKTPKGRRVTISDEDGKEIYKAEPKSVIDKIIKNQKVPKEFDFVCATYSQFASEKPTVKQSFLRAITTKKTIVIMDESHNASGTSATGLFLKEIVRRSKSTIFLSATFAKRPDNMPIYALKTSMQDANMNDEELVNAISTGGVALQEVLAAQLVQEGQMIRRERTYEGIDINYFTLDELAVEHGKIADAITDIIRDMIGFQANYVDGMVEELDGIATAENKEVTTTKGTREAGVDNQPYFSRVFNVINQMLFAIKADAVADLAIKRLKEGKKPVIAFSSTMESFMNEMQIDDIINADFKEVLKRGLESVTSYTTTDDAGFSVKESFTPDQMDMEARASYYEILGKIDRISTGIVISPIDHIVQKINKAGFSTAEVTGRKKQVQLSYTKNGIVGEIQKRQSVETNVAFTGFNNNEVDVLLINQSGSTGASAQAKPTDKVPKDKVKQRVMIVLQAELNINTEVQKRGRINRTGQIIKPQYDYVASAIPAEQRLQMMLQKKMKSLDANTTSNQKNSEDLMKSDDFLNKYGDKIVETWLIENPEMNRLLGNLITKDTKDIENLAHKTSGRVAILPIIQQKTFYKNILNQYHNEIKRLIQNGEYDLELENMNLEAETEDKKVVVVGKNSNSVFGGNTYLEKCEINNLSKPYSKKEVLEMLNNAGFDNAADKQNKMVAMYDQYVEGEIAKIFINVTEKWEKVRKNISKEKGYSKAEDTKVYITNRIDEIESIVATDIEDKKRKFKNQSDMIRGFLRFFKVGRGLNFPIISYDGGAGLADAIVLDASFNKNADNPYTPSNINFKIAISNSDKVRDLKTSGTFQQDLNAIVGVSYQLNDYNSKKILENWDLTTRESNVNRTNRYIVTGNILQGYGKFDKGRLVSYTLQGGGVQKGILMPTNWRPSTDFNSTDNSVNVPILKAYPIIKSGSNGASTRTNTSLTLQRVIMPWRDENYLKVYIAASRKQGGSIYLDPKILKLVKDNNFNKIGAQMTTDVSIENLEAFLKILDNDHSISALIPQSRLEDIPDVVKSIEKATKLETKGSSSKAKILKLKAKAIAIKQKQLLIAI